MLTIDKRILFQIVPTELVTEPDCDGITPDMPLVLAVYSMERDEDGDTEVFHHVIAADELANWAWDHDRLPPGYVPPMVANGTHQSPRWP